MAQGTTGQQIHNLAGLRWAVDERRAVIVPRGHAFNRPIPAAVMINQNGGLLLRLFNTGMYIYKKPQKKKGPPSVVGVGLPPTKCDVCKDRLWFMHVEGYRFYARTADGQGRIWWAYCVNCRKRFKFETLAPKRGKS